MQGINTNIIQLNQCEDSKRVHPIFKLELPEDKAQLVLILTIAKM
jgi:hypothetical protein